MTDKVDIKRVICEILSELGYTEDCSAGREIIAALHDRGYVIVKEFLGLSSVAMESPPGYREVTPDTIIPEWSLILYKGYYAKSDRMAYQPKVMSNFDARVDLVYKDLRAIWYMEIKSPTD